MLLHKTLAYLEEHHGIKGNKVRSLHLTHHFTVVELDDGNIGACMSCYSFPIPVLESLRDALTEMLRQDPLLLGLLFSGETDWPSLPLEDQREVFLCSLRTAVISALSAKVIRAGGDATFLVSPAPPFDPSANVRSALVIGFGGPMNALARSRHVTALHVSDLTYPARREEMDSTIAALREQHPQKLITISDGHDTLDRLRFVDLISITGSTLCNGTLYDLLVHARDVQMIVVQGQSASIHPKALFEQGVHLVTTTLKPHEFVDLAKSDLSGKRLLPWMEGGLPRLYLTPRQLR